MKHESAWTRTLSMWGRTAAAFGRVGHVLDHHMGQTDDVGEPLSAYDGEVERPDMILALSDNG